MSKYIQFVLIVVACVALDQWTKQIASTRLATSHRSFHHPIVLEISDDDAGRTVEEVLLSEFETNSSDEVVDIAHRYVRTVDGRRLVGDHALEAGEEIEVLYRKVIVVPDYFELEYTRNPGAAFGLWSQLDDPYRIPFFLGVAVLALVVIVLMLRGLERHEQLAIWALSLIAGGAIGNFIDRFTYGWVIDFIVWKYGDEYRWPTFNLADTFISIGVALLVLEMIVDTVKNRDESPEPLSEE